MQKIIEFFEQDLIFSTFLIISIILSFFYPDDIKNYINYIDFNTISSLTGLLITTTSIKESGYLNIISRVILRKLKKEKHLAIFLVLISILLSPILTNDISLFIVIPLTLSIADLIKTNINKLIIFEAIGANVGSLLTPIGNPQNLFLYYKWKISFIKFVFNMFPLFIVTSILLIIFTSISFSNSKIKFSKNKKNTRKFDKKLFILSIIMLIIFIISIEFKQEKIILILLTIIYFIFFREILYKINYTLIVLLILIFIDVHLISKTNIVLNLINKIDLNKSLNVYLLSILTSQIISNVPATILIEKFCKNFLAISYGVNIGGNGFIIGSLANIIALKIANKKKIWIEFHKYSIIYLILSAFIGYIVLFLKS